jgi:hypothetical protein
VFLDIIHRPVLYLKQQPNTTYRKYKKSAHLSLVEHPIRQPSLDISPHLDSHHRSRNQKTTDNSVQCRLCVKTVCLYVGTVQRICLFSGDFYSESTLVLTAIAMKQCMNIGARPCVCGVILMFLIFGLTLGESLCCASFIYPILYSCWCADDKD